MSYQERLEALIEDLEEHHQKEIRELFQNVPETKKEQVLAEISKIHHESQQRLLTLLKQG